jgi:hypothetical protein
LQYIGTSLLVKPNYFSILGFSPIIGILLLFIASLFMINTGHNYFEHRHPPTEEKGYNFKISFLASTIHLLYMTVGYKKEEVQEAQKYVESEIKQYWKSD